MLQCPANPLRKASIAQFHKDCRRTDGSWFPPILADLVGQWLTNPDIIPTFEKARDTFLRRHIVPKAFSDNVHQAIADQSAIGWLQAFRGFLAKTWMVVASSSFDAAKVTTRPDGATKIRQVLKALHQLSTALWKSRNSALHTTEQCSRLSVINAEITQYHGEPEQLLGTDRFYCETSLHKLLSSSASIKRRWLHRVKRSKEKREKMDKQQPRITQYFRTAAHRNGNPITITKVAPLIDPRSPPTPQLLVRTARPSNS
jgi:hypothetical protein